MVTDASNIIRMLSYSNTVVSLLANFHKKILSYLDDYLGKIQIFMKLAPILVSRIGPLRVERFFFHNYVLYMLEIKSRNS